MAVTMLQVLKLLTPDEPDYRAASRYGAQLLPHLGTLIRGNNRGLASKAVFLAGLIPDPRSAQLLAHAARNSSPIVRVAAAGAARFAKDPAVRSVVAALLSDRDAGVRKSAVKAAAVSKDQHLLSRVAQLTQNDPSSAIRSLAQRALKFARGQV